MQFSYTLENLNCANCAGKIENKIINTDGFENVSFNFANKLLKFSSAKHNPLAEIQQICDSIEDGVTVVDNLAKQPVKAENSNKISIDLVLFVISIVLGVASAVIHFTVPESNTIGFYSTLVMSAAATVFAGYKTFLKGFKSVLKLRIDETTLLSIAVIAAFILGEFVEGAMVTILFALGEIIEDKAVNSSRKGIQKLAQIRPDTATLITNGTEQIVSAESVKIGSTIIVKPYDRIPLDGVVIEGNSTVDMSALTGESLPVDVHKDSEVLSGAINGNSLIKVKTTKEFGNSTATRILQLVEDAAAKKGQSERFISKFASVYTPIIIAISVIIAVVPPLLGLGTFGDWVYRALVCLVASCPCAIVISVPLSYYSGIGAASKIGVLIKGGKYIEALTKADTFVFDKTGTLTSGKLSVNEVNSVSDFSEEKILALASACEMYSSHPIALAIKTKAEGLELPQLSDYSENAGHGTSAMYNGKQLLCGGAKILSDSQKQSINTNASVFVVYDGELIGTISVSDTIRDESKAVIAQLKEVGITNTVMLTGDSKTTAQSVSKQLNLDSFKAELMPSDKLKAVEQLKQNSNGVCFVGDGINDAPVLSASDCGFAMGFGSETAIESADCVLASNNLKQLPKAIKISRKVMATIKTNIIFALAVKALVIVLATLGIASMWMSVLADTGVSVACVLYASRLLKSKY